ncbi:hypothetical protein C0Q70_04904 [Pomacea canaliculata]|uniref:Uncharacterized protein n=1 Tax=Pomacea canaliculata TaxID=400727 RepID=A0A2T7PJN6_POMCA|nr:hypothetical protein C0Q70_04904 [Pomacea canaliculata]
MPEKNNTLARDKLVHEHPRPSGPYLGRLYQVSAEEEENKEEFTTFRAQSEIRAVGRHRPTPGASYSQPTNDLCAPSSPVSFPVLFLSRVSCLPILHKANRPDTRKTTLPYPRQLSQDKFLHIDSVCLLSRLVSTLVQHPARKANSDAFTAGDFRCISENEPR